MLYKNETEVKIGDLCMLPNGKVGTVTDCGGVLFLKSKYETSKITDRTLIKLS